MVLVTFNVYKKDVGESILYVTNDKNKDHYIIKFYYKDVTFQCEYSGVEACLDIIPKDFLGASEQESGGENANEVFTMDCVLDEEGHIVKLDDFTIIIDNDVFIFDRWKGNVEYPSGYFNFK